MVMEEVTPDESSDAVLRGCHRGLRRTRYSFDDVVQSRMCDSCQGRLDEEVEERFTVLDKKTGRASFEIGATSTARSRSA